MRSLRAFAACGIVLPIAGCALPLGCTGPAQPGLGAELIFGRNIGAELGVSEAAWRRFVEEEIAPRFPEGFTVVDGRGQWRDPQGRILTEPSKVLLVAAADGPETRARLAAVAEVYKTRFRQKSVVSILKPGCVAF
jgi:hypothetical protein